MNWHDWLCAKAKKAADLILPPAETQALIPEVWIDHIRHCLHAIKRENIMVDDTLINRAIANLDAALEYYEANGYKRDPRIRAKFHALSEDINAIEHNTGMERIISRASHYYELNEQQAESFKHALKREWEKDTVFYDRIEDYATQNSTVIFDIMSKALGLDSPKEFHVEPPKTAYSEMENEHSVAELRAHVAKITSITNPLLQHLHTIMAKAHEEILPPLAEDSLLKPALEDTKLANFVKTSYAHMLASQAAFSLENLERALAKLDKSMPSRS